MKTWIKLYTDGLEIYKIKEQFSDNGPGPPRGFGSPSNSGAPENLHTIFERLTLGCSRVI
jgi:hypothetical protein